MTTVCVDRFLTGGSWYGEVPEVCSSPPILASTGYDIALTVIVATVTIAVGLIIHALTHRNPRRYR